MPLQQSHCSIQFLAGKQSCIRGDPSSVELEPQPLVGLDAERLPSRSTFNRFVTRLSKHQDLVEECLSQVTTRLQELLPDFGENMAVDSTIVRSHSNLNKKVVSDPEASWTAKTGSNGKKQWFWGYKLHLAVDADYELPLAMTVTTAGVHILRHTAAKLRRDVGESVEEVRRFLDHSSLAVTTIYLRRLEGQKDRGWEKVMEAIGV
jgi:hypothetical protein